MLPHSAIFGHLPVVGRILAGLPRDAHADYLMLLIQDQWRTLFPGAARYDRCPPAVYLDLWPMSPPMLLSMDPAVSAQFTQDVNVDKAESQANFLRPLTDNLDVASMPGGAPWKRVRRRMLPAFSPQAIRQHIPALLEEVEVFRGLLFEAAGSEEDPQGWGTVFPLEPRLMMLTLDITARFTLGSRMHEQTMPLAPISRALHAMLPWLTIHIHIGNVLGLVNPWRQLSLWWGRRTMDVYLRPILAERRSAKADATSQADEKGGGSDTLVDTLFTALAADPPAATMDYVLAETKHTLLAGHENTAFTLAYLFHTLARHPRILAAVCAEHDAVLGADPAAAADRLRAAPHLLGRLAYTTAVVKETMRVHTTASTLRAGRAGFALYTPSDAGAGLAGLAFPTEGCVLWDGNFAMHHNPALFTRPLEVIPERWLQREENAGEKDDGNDDDDDDNDDDDDDLLLLRGPRNAYRPFELGPRNCIGQHLAMTEMLMALALVVRELEVVEAWDAWDALQPAHTPKQTVWGERLYQVSKNGPPHVKDGMPVRVRRRLRRQPTEA